MPSSGAAGERLFEWLADPALSADVQLVIYRHRIYGGAGGPLIRTYKPEDHMGHLHIESRRPFAA